jgi:transposase
MANKRQNVVILTPEQHNELANICKSRTEEIRRVQRAKVLLMAAEGETNMKIAEDVGYNHNSVRKIIVKFCTYGLEQSLNDLPRSGRPRRINDDARMWVINQACRKTEDLGYPQALWTITKLTQHVNENCTEAGHECLSGVTRGTIWKIINDRDVKPHLIKYYLERRDPEFDSKQANVISTYKKAEIARENNDTQEKGEVFISYDEKPGIQAIKNIYPDRPPTLENGFVRRDYEYQRLGTVSLLAGKDLVTGEVIPYINETHKSSDFIEFLKILDQKYPWQAVITVVLDNHSAHTSKETRAYLDSRPGRFEFVFTPKHGSWLNLIEVYFSKLSRVCLKGMRVNSKDELIDRIYRFIGDENVDPVIYKWNYDGKAA